MTVRQSTIDISLWLPVTKIPNHYGAAAILPFWNRPFKASIFDWMIFHLYCQSLVSRKITRSLGNRPAFQHAMPAQPEVIMQPTRRMLLHNKGQDIFSVGSTRSAAWL